MKFTNDFGNFEVEFGKRYLLEDDFCIGEFEVLDYYDDELICVYNNRCIIPMDLDYIETVRAI